MPDSVAWVLGRGSHHGDLPWQFVAFVAFLLGVTGYLVYRELQRFQAEWTGAGDDRAMGWFDVETSV